MTDKPDSGRPHTDGKAKKALATCSGAHVVHDGVSDILYVLLPALAQHFGLSLAQVGLIRSAHRAAMTLFQIPVAVWAERIGEKNLLVLGTALSGAAWIALGMAPGFIPLLLILFVAGLGTAVQHPLAAAIVSQAYPEQGRRIAIGQYNFWGDFGKLAFAGGASIWLGFQLPWQVPGYFFGALTLAAALVILVMLNNLDLGGHPDRPKRAQESERQPAESRPVRSKGWGIKHGVGFSALCTIKLFDSLTRTGFLTFAAFLLIAKGIPEGWAVQAPPIIFIGGMIGKLAFGYLAERFGVFRTVIAAALTTGSGIFLILLLPGWSAMLILAFTGITLNGTSSVLYGSVGDYIDANKQGRAFGLFYTLGSAAGIIAPLGFGLIGDWAGIEVTIAIVGALPFFVIPLCFVLRSSARELEHTAGLAVEKPAAVS
ncbi:MAG: MFS transporter [Rhodospirillales bacterium]